MAQAPPRKPPSAKRSAKQIRAWRRWVGRRQRLYLYTLPRTARMWTDVRALAVAVWRAKRIGKKPTGERVLARALRNLRRLLAAEARAAGLDPDAICREARSRGRDGPATPARAPMPDPSTFRPRPIVDEA